MLRLVNMTVAGAITEVSKDQVTIEAHGNSVKLSTVNFATQPKVGQTIYMEVSVYQLDIKPSG